MENQSYRVGGIVLVLVIVAAWILLHEGESAVHEKSNPIGDAVELTAPQHEVAHSSLEEDGVGGNLNIEAPVTTRTASESEAESGPSEVAIYVHYANSTEPAIGAQVYLFEFNPELPALNHAQFPFEAKVFEVTDSEPLVFSRTQFLDDNVAVVVKSGEVYRRQIVTWPTDGNRSSMVIQVEPQGKVEIWVTQNGVALPRQMIMLYPVSPSQNTGQSAFASTDDNGFAFFDSVEQGKWVAGIYLEASIFLGEQFELRADKVQQVSVETEHQTSLDVRVEDRNGDIIPGIFQVTVRSESGENWGYRNTQSGVAHFPRLVPGTYSLSAKRTGPTGPALPDLTFDTQFAKISPGGNEVTLKPGRTVD